MTDLAKRLRLDWTPIFGGCVGTMFDAADYIESLESRIEFLEGAIREIAKVNNKRDRFSDQIDGIIIAALGENNV